MYSLSSFISVALVATSALAAPSKPFGKTKVEGDAICASAQFTVRASATNIFFNITAPATKPEFDAAVNAVLSGQVNPVGGTRRIEKQDWTLYGKYCVPKKATKDKKKARSIQVIEHSALETSAELDITFKPSRYSYQRNMAKDGYATFAFDRLGAGKSQIPKDGLNIVQGPLHVEILRSIVHQLKDGSLVGKKYPEIVGVGHSYGASLINAYVAKYPADLASIILLGYTHILKPTFPALLNLTQALKKGSSSPNLKKGSDSYLAISTRQSRINAFFQPGGYDEAVFNWDLAQEGTFTLGEFLTLQAQQVTAPKFKGDVIYAIGKEDAAFELKSKSYEQKFFPKAASFTVKTYAKTNHAILLHYSALDVLKDLRAFLKKTL